MPATRGQKGREPAVKPTVAAATKNVKKEPAKRKAPAKAVAFAEVPVDEDTNGQDPPQEVKEAAPRPRATRGTKAAPKKSETSKKTKAVESEESIAAAPAEESKAPARGARTARGGRAAVVDSTEAKDAAPSRRVASAKSKTAATENKATAPASRSTRGRRTEAAESSKEEVQEKVEPPKRKVARKAPVEKEQVVEESAPVNDVPAPKTRTTRGAKAEKLETAVVEEPETAPKANGRGRAASKAANVLVDEQSNDAEPAASTSGAVPEAQASTARTRGTRGTKQNMEAIVQEEPRGRATRPTRGTAGKEAVAEVEPLKKKATKSTTEAKRTGRKRKAQESNDDTPEMVAEDEVSKAPANKKRAVRKNDVHEETVQVSESHDTIEQPEQIATEEATEPTLLFADVTSPLLGRISPLKQSKQTVEVPVQSAPDMMEEASPLFGSPTLARLATPAQTLRQPSCTSAAGEAYRQDAFEDVLEEGPAFSLSMISFVEGEAGQEALNIAEEALAEAEREDTFQADEPAPGPTTEDIAMNDAFLAEETREPLRPTCDSKIESSIQSKGRRSSEVVGPSSVAIKQTSKESLRRQTMFPRVSMPDVKSKTSDDEDPAVNNEGHEPMQTDGADEQAAVVESIDFVTSPLKLAAIDEAKLLAATTSPRKAPVSQAKTRRVSFVPGQPKTQSRNALRRKSMFPSVDTVLESTLEESAEVLSLEKLEMTSEAPAEECAPSQPRSSWTPVNKPVSGLRRISTSLASPLPNAKLQFNRRRSMFPSAATGKLVDKATLGSSDDSGSIVDSAVVEDEQPEEATVASVEDADMEDKIAEKLEAAATDAELPETARERPLSGTTWYVAVYDKGECANDLWIPGLEELGAVVNQEWHEDDNEGLVTHVLFNNGSRRTLQRASDAGAKCVKISYVLDVEAAETQLDEDDTRYKIDLSKHLEELTSSPKSTEEAFVVAPMGIIDLAPVLQLPQPDTPQRSLNGKENLPPFFLSPDKKTPKVQASPKIPLGMRSCPPKQLMKPLFEPVSKSPKVGGKRRLSFDQSGDRKRPQFMSPLKNVTHISAIVEEENSWLF